MPWTAASVVTLCFAAASLACTRVAPRPAATTPPMTAAPGIVATAAAPVAASSAAPTAAPVAAPTAGAPSAGVLAHEEIKWQGVVGEVTEFRRKGNTLTAKVRLRNQGTAPVDADILYPEAYVMDAAAGKKYSVLKDEKGSFIAALRPGRGDRWSEMIQPGQGIVIWAKLPAPPLEVKAVTLQIPGVSPFDDLAIQDF